MVGKKVTLANALAKQVPGGCRQCSGLSRVYVPTLSASGVGCKNSAFLQIV